MEKHNNLGYNLYNLYYVIAEIRHASTHSDLVIKKSRLNKFTKEQLSILQGFKIANEIDKGSEIVLNKIKADFIVKRLTEIGFTIFKAFSMQYHEDWKDLLKNY